MHGESRLSNDPKIKAPGPLSSSHAPTTRSQRTEAAAALQHVRVPLDLVHMHPPLVAKELKQLLSLKRSQN